MKRFLSLMLALLLSAAPALAETITLDEPLTGVVCWPEGSTEADAAYVYRYSYPHVAGDGEVAGTINETYAYLVEDALAFTVPITAETLESTDVQAYTNVVSQVTCLNDAYLSVLIVTESFLGASSMEVYAGHTFALTGERAGIATSLPRLLGLLDDKETDEWLLDRQTAKANDLVWGLVWSIMEEQRAAGDVNFDPDLTYDMLTQDFYPEEDFYLDGDGNLVFFIQAATVASAADGVLTYPFSLEELKDEL